jgi:hypothetical protein
VTYLKPGALSGQNPKFMPKPVVAVPAIVVRADAVRRDNRCRNVSGVNVEMLGMQQAAGQAARSIYSASNRC